MIEANSRNDWWRMAMMAGFDDCEFPPDSPPDNTIELNSNSRGIIEALRAVSRKCEETQEHDTFWDGRLGTELSPFERKQVIGNVIGFFSTIAGWAAEAAEKAV